MIGLFHIPDKQRNYQGYMVYALTIIWSVVTGLTVSMGFYFFPYLWQRWLALLGCSIFIAAFNLGLNRLGYVRMASWTLTCMLWLYITIPNYSAGGIMAPGIISQMSVILTAGFLLGWRGGLAFGLLTMATDLGLVFLQIEGNLPEPTVVHTPFTRWIGAIIPFGTILALQYYATNHLRSSLITMQEEIKKREKAENIKDQTLYTLRERVKELKVLYTVSQILQTDDFSPEKLCRKIAEVLPAGWQYPDITAALVCIGNTEYHTSNYKSSQFSQHAEMRTAKGTKVGIQIIYLEARPEMDEGPFLKEERSLINMLVEMLKIDWDGRERRAELKDYRYALDIASIVSISAVNGSFTFVNDNFCKASKYSAEELLGRNQSIIWSGAHSPEYFRQLRNAMQHGKPYRGEFLNRAKDGTLYWVDSSIVPFLNEEGKVYQYLSINHDITERKKAETELKESEEKFRSLVEQTLVGVFIMQEDRFIYINPGFEKIVGYPKQTLLKGMGFGNLLHEADANRMFKEYVIPGVEPSSSPAIFRLIRNNGEVVYIEAILSAIIYNNHPALIGTVVDITHRMEEEKRIGKAVIDAQENERLQIGMELHDNVKQILAASNMTLIFALDKFEDKKLSVAAIIAVKDYISEAINELRRLSHQLAPSVDSSISLSEKINSLIKNMNSDNRLSIQIHVDDLGPSIKNDIPLTLYRILQEQFSNIIKYADATLAEISITVDDGNTRLLIKDNGKGFDVNESKNGIGLENIKRRVQALQGEVQIFSAPGQGCEIQVQIPVA